MSVDKYQIKKREQLKARIIQEFKSISVCSHFTGIHQSILSRMLNGFIPLTEDHKATLREFGIKNFSE